jgi:hypothetical protein
MQIAYAAEPALPCQDAGRDAVPVAAMADRKVLINQTMVNGFGARCSELMRPESAPIARCPLVIGCGRPEDFRHFAEHGTGDGRLPLHRRNAGFEAGTSKFLRLELGDDDRIFRLEEQKEASCDNPG